MQDARGDARLLDIDDNQLEQSIVDENAITGVQVFCEPLIGDRDLVRMRDLFFRREDDFASILELNGPFEVADPDARTLEIAENRYRTFELVGHRADESNRLRVLLV